MATSEIEKLERRYAENPQGLTFAPLAEVHRKSGDVARALDLLRAGLELHPNYIPASIVLGRCHWDLGDLPAAESAFAHVLRLDDENVIALKSLADINERLERFAEAQRWLQRLVSVDRSNEEARQQLARLEAPPDRGDRKAQGAPAPSTATELPHEIAAAEPAPATVKPPLAAAAPASAAIPPEPETSETASLELTAALAEPTSPPPSSSPERDPAEAKSSSLEFLDTSEPPEAAQPAPVDGLISQEFVPPKETTYRLHPELTQEFVSAKDFPDRLHVETTEGVELQSSGASEFRVPNAAEDFMELASQVNPTPEDTPTLASAKPAPAKERFEADRKDTPPTPAEAVPISSGLKLVTDTKPAPAAQSFAASETKGQSVASFFRALLASRPTGNSGSPAAPRPAAGKEEPANPPTVSAPGQTKDGTVSFDDFFGSAAGGASPLAQGSSDPSNDDLDQFQSWLQNLKR
jgi:hypothetical protein